MAHDEGLTERIRSITDRHPDTTERKMFGGVCFMVNGNMACGVAKEDLMLRLGNELAAAALEEPHTRPMDFTGRVMKSMIFVASEGIEDDEALESWVDRALRFARSLPPK